MSLTRPPVASPNTYASNGYSRILAEVLDELLGQHLRLSDEHLDSQAEDQSLTDRTVGRARHHRR